MVRESSEHKPYASMERVHITYRVSDVNDNISDGCGEINLFSFVNEHIHNGDIQCEYSDGMSTVILLYIISTHER